MFQKQPLNKDAGERYINLFLNTEGQTHTDVVDKLLGYVPTSAQLVDALYDSLKAKSNNQYQ